MNSLVRDITRLLVAFFIVFASFSGTQNDFTTGIFGHHINLHKGEPGPSHSATSLATIEKDIKSHKGLA